MIASLAMYDLPWLREANDRLWHAVAADLPPSLGAPETLTRDADLDDTWRSPRLLLGQTCGYPLVTELRETVQLVATPHYRADGCEGAFHRSAIVVRAEAPAREVAELRGLRAGVNGRRSNTGMNLFRAAIAPLAEGKPFFSEVTVTGSHARSLAALLSGRIDVAAIDAVTFAHLRRRYPRHAERVRVLAWTERSPSLPLVTAMATDLATIEALRSALVSATGAAEALNITAFEALTLEDYRVVLELEERAIALGYPILA